MSVGKPLALRTLHGGQGPGHVGETQFRPVIVAEVVFRQVAVKVLLPAMLIDAVEAPLEQTEKALGRVHMHIFPGVFLG